MLKEIKRKKIKNENNYVKESLGLEMKREDSWKEKEKKGCAKERFHILKPVILGEPQIEER